MTRFTSSDMLPMYSRLPSLSQSHTSSRSRVLFSSSAIPITKSNSSSHTGLSVSRFVDDLCSCLPHDSFTNGSERPLASLAARWSPRIRRTCSTPQNCAKSPPAMISSRDMPRTRSCSSTSSSMSSKGMYLATNAISGPTGFPRSSRLLLRNARAILLVRPLLSERLKTTLVSSYGLSTSCPTSYSHTPSTLCELFFKRFSPSIALDISVDFSAFDMRVASRRRSSAASRSGSSAAPPRFPTPNACRPAALTFLYVVAVSTTDSDSFAPRMSCTRTSKVSST